MFFVFLSQHSVGVQLYGFVKLGLIPTEYTRGVHFQSERQGSEHEEFSSFFAGVEVLLYLVTNLEFVLSF